MWSKKREMAVERRLWVQSLQHQVKWPRFSWLAVLEGAGLALIKAATECCLLI